MKKYAWIGAGVILALAGCFLVTGGFAGDIEPVGAEEADGLLAAVLLGCDTAAARVSASAGRVILHEWSWRDSGELLETETVYTVASNGERFRAAVDTRYIRNERTPPESEPDLHFNNAPGTIVKTVIGYDGETVTMYEPARRRAVISGADSEIGRRLRTVKLMALSPGLALPTFPTTLPSPDNPNPGPYVLGRQTVNGEECLVVESVRTSVLADGTSHEYRSRFWIMPQKGFSIAKSATLAHGGVYGEGPVVLSEAGVRTRQYDDGLWGISEVQQEQYGLDSSGRLYLSARRVTSFSEDYALNAPVTDQMLAVALPSGTTVSNELIDAEYSVR